MDTRNHCKSENTRNNEARQHPQSDKSECTYELSVTMYSSVLKWAAHGGLCFFYYLLS